MRQTRFQQTAIAAFTVSSANASTGPFSGRSPAMEVQVCPHRQISTIRFEVFIFMILKSGIHRAGIVIRRCHPAYISYLRHASKLGVLRPVLTAVAGDLHQPINRYQRKSILFPRGLRERDDVSVQRRRLILRNRIRAPHFAHHREVCLRSICRVRSLLTAFHVSPRSSLRTACWPRNTAVYASAG